MVIELGKYRPAGSKVFSGRDKGEHVRSILNLNQIDTTEEEVIIVVPKDTFSINTSFFLGLFGWSIRNLGEAKFREKYRFECNNKIIVRSIDDNIKRALKSPSMLGKTV